MTRAVTPSQFCEGNLLLAVLKLYQTAVVHSAALYIAALLHHDCIGSVW